MNDALQTTINRMSLVMTIPEDVVKACKKAELPNEMVEVLLRLHDQQVQLEKVVNSQQETLLQIAQIVNVQADFAGNLNNTLKELVKRQGYDPNEMVSSEEIIKDL